MKTILILFLLFCELVSAQLLTKVKVNTSTTTTYNWSYSNQGTNHYYAFRRGEGTTSSDKQILVCISNNGGNSFIEKNVTINEAAVTYTPVVASTASSIVVIYAYKDASNNEKVCIARSTNNGNSFSLTTNSDPDFYNNVWFLQYYSLYSYVFISDNTTKYYLMGHYGRDLFISTDNGLSFNRVPGPNTQSTTFPNSVRIAAHPTLGLWAAFDNNNDTIHVYYTTNNGTNYFHKHSFFIDLAGAGFDCSFNGNQFLLFYSYEEVGQEKVYLKKITPTSVSSPALVYTSSDGIYAFDSGNKNDLLGIASGEREFLFSTNNGTSWTKPILLGAELFPSDFYTFSIVNNTTIAAGFLVFESSTSLRNIYHCNIKLTDKPFFTSVTITEPFWYGIFQWSDYVEVTHHQFQVAADEQFTNVLFDTLMVQHTNSVFIHLMRFCESGGTYYYRVRGKTGTYYTGWSDPGNFDYTFTDIKEENNYPNEYSLSQNYPNPFNPTTKITFTVPEESRVRITIYDLLGNEVKELLDEQKPRGSYILDINASELPSGVYFYRLKAGSYIVTRKMMLLK